MAGFHRNASRSSKIGSSAGYALVHMVTLIGAGPVQPGERCLARQATG